MSPELGCTGGQADDQVFMLTAPVKPSTVPTVPPQVVVAVDQVQSITESMDLPLEAATGLARNTSSEADAKYFIPGNQAEDRTGRS